LLTVDSNFDHLSSSEISKQAERFRKDLGTLEDDATVKGIIVASHHPPYTNSEFGGNAQIINMFAEPFLKAKKTRLYLSGHVHSYERFVSGDKVFVVTGGGGGPQRTVSVDADRPYQNDAYRKGSLRPFHYLRMKVSDSGLDVSTMMLGRDMKFRAGDSFSMGLYA
jgi:hypothetical protein